MYNIPCIEYKRMRPDVKVSSVLRKGAWTAQEDMLLKNCVEKFGEGKWHLVPLKAGLNRCRKSCRLRWLNYLRPNIKRGDFGEDEVDLMLRLHKLLGNRWSLIAGRIPGRTGNDVKNYWNTHLRSRSKQQKQQLKQAESSQHTTVTIIKPKPRTFSRILNDHNPQSAANAANDDGNLIGSLNDDVDNVANISPGIISNPGEPDNKINEYLDGLFDDRQQKEIDDEVKWSFGGFSGDGEALYVVEQGDNPNSLLDLCKDDFMWDLLDLE